MGQVLQFEADRRAITITLNSFNTDLSRDDRMKLYPRIGRLNPAGLEQISRCDDYEQLRAVVEMYGVSV